MNIQILAREPQISVTHFPDKLAVKMPTEFGQMLALAYSLDELKLAPKTKSGKYRGHSHAGHPCSKWATANIRNWKWLLKYANLLCDEKENVRYPNNGPHGIRVFLDWCEANPPNLPQLPTIDHIYCGPEQYRVADVVESYRNYMIGDKQHIAQWTNREKPHWWK